MSTIFSEIILRRMLLTRFRGLWLFVRFLDHFENLAVLSVVILFILFEIYPAIFTFIDKSFLCS